MHKKGTLLLKRSDIQQLMTLKDYIRGMEEAFSMIAREKSFGTGMLHADYKATEFHIKSGGINTDHSYFAIKANGSCYTNRSRYGIPNMMGTILLFDADNAFPLAVLDSIDITRNRTGATTAVAAKYLARKDSKTVTICGCGNQGRIQLTALNEVFSIEKVFACSRSVRSATDYAEEMNDRLDCRVVVVSDLKTAALESDIIVTCTPAKEAYLKRDYVRRGTFISAIGADSPDKQEIDTELLTKSIVVADLPEQCARVGELHHAVDSGSMKISDIYGTLGDITCGNLKGRLSDDEIIIFDATGTAVQDAAGAALCYEKAIKNNVGQFINLNS